MISFLGFVSGDKDDACVYDCHTYWVTVRKAVDFMPPHDSDLYVTPTTPNPP